MVYKMFPQKHFLLDYVSLYFHDPFLDSQSNLFLSYLLITYFRLFADYKNLWGIERSGFFNGREKWAKGFENQRV